MILSLFFFLMMYAIRFGWMTTNIYKHHQITFRNSQGMTDNHTYPESTFHVPGHIIAMPLKRLQSTSSPQARRYCRASRRNRLMWTVSQTIFASRTRTGLVLAGQGGSFAADTACLGHGCGVTKAKEAFVHDDVPLGGLCRVQPSRAERGRGLFVEML